MWDSCAQFVVKPSPLSFSDVDMPKEWPQDNEPMVITGMIGGY
jgi:hypothetical protein